MNTIARKLRPAIIWFNVGILIAFVTLFGAALNVRSQALAEWLSLEKLLIYDLLACVHVVVLFLLFRRESGNHDVERSAATLYTAGFIHTLLSIGLALCSLAAVLYSRESASLKDILVVIAPLGAAVLPHACAVWFGLALEHSHRSPTRDQETFFKALVTDANEANRSLQDLFTKRSEAVRSEIRAVEILTARITSLGHAAEGALQEAKTAISELSSEGKVVVADAKSATGALRRAFASSSTAVDGLGVSANVLAEALKKAAPATQATAKELATARDTVAKLNELQAAIVDLLTSTLFAKGKDV
jgi:hypothetical protein